MSDRELLNSIADLLEEKLDEKFVRLEDRIGKVEEKIVRLEDRIGKVEEKIVRLEDRIGKVEDRIGKVEEKIVRLEEKTDDINDRLRKVEIVQENEILPRVRTIEECYLSTSIRYQSGADKIDTMKKDIDVLKLIAREHSEKIEKLA